MKRNDLVGQFFGRLTVVEIAGLNTKQNVLWRCVCVCSGEAVAPAYDLRGGKVKSCGCLVREGSNTKHGMARSGKKRSRLYSVWSSMLARCSNPRDRNYHHYGGRGIKVCKRWETFENFFVDMGEPEVGLTLDRRNNNRGYTPSNCQWVLSSAQSRNKRTNVWVTVIGKKHILADALLLVGKSRSALHYQMRKNNQSHQQVLNTWQKQKKHT